MYQSIRKKLSKSYKMDRENAKNRKLEDIKSLYEKHPLLKDLDDRIKYQGILLTKCILHKSGDEIGLAEDKLHSLKIEKETFLKSNNIYDTYYIEEYKCKFCNDTGFVTENNNQFQCSCRMQKIIDGETDSQLLKLTEVNNFDTFNLNEFSDEVNKVKYGIPISPRKKQENNKKIAMYFILNFENTDRKNLFFAGQSGLGKTFLASCIAKEIMKKNFTVLFQSSPVLFDTILKLKYNFEKAVNLDITYDDILKVNLLIIDDLGSESLTSNKLAELLNILNSRKTNDMYKPCKTIISTNITDMKLLEQNFKERIFSRIIGDFDLLFFAGDDIRIKNTLHIK